MTTQLQVYRDAARFAADVTIDTLAEDAPIRYALDEAWVGGPLFVLRQAAWRFALVTVNSNGAAPGTIPGYTYKFSMPANWTRTHSIFKLSDSKECPVDIKEETGSFFGNITPLTIRYVSETYVDLSYWTEHFSKAVAAYLAFDIVDKISGDPARKSQMWDLFQQYLRNAMEHDALTEDPWLNHQLDGSFLSASRNMLTQGFWRFALNTVTPGSSGTAEPGFTTLYTKPDDWLRTQSVYVLNGLTELPVNCREGPEGWSSSATSIYVRYISDTYLDSTTWPEEFMRVVAAYLGISWGDGGPVSDKGEPQLPWPQYLQRALDNLTVPESAWLKHQFDGSFLSASKSMLEQGFWNFSLRTDAPTVSGSSIVGFSTSFIKPDGWMRTHSIFKLSGSKELPVDCREQGNFWFANEPIRVRYVSNSYLDPATWPEEFTRVVAAYLGIDWGDGNARAVTPDGQGGQKLVLWQQYLQRALSNISVQPSPWLSFQLDGSFAHAVDKMLESGLWKHAINTVSIDYVSDVASPSYAYAFNKPTDWIRTDHIYEQIGTPTIFPTADCDIDFRDEGGLFHANVTPIICRYLSSTLGRAPENWSDDFMGALLAYLNYQQAVANPQTSGAGLQAKLAAYKDAEKNARIKDEMRERPKMFTVGMLRRSRGGRSNYDREQGWRW